MKATIWLTKKCNLACSYCYEGIEKENLSMNKNIINKLIEFLLSKKEPLSIRFHGGEPLLEFDLIDYFIKTMNEQNVKKVSVDYHITTNGLLASEKIVEYLNKYMRDVSLSIDGNKMVNDLNRHTKSGEGSYDILEKKCAIFLKYNPFTRARMTFTSETVNSLFDSVDHVAKLGFRIITAVPDQFDKRWRYEQSEILKKEIQRIAEKYGKRDDIHINLIDKSLFHRYASCTGGTNNVSIGADGKIYPCSMAVEKSEFVIGDIWNGISNEKLNDILIHSKVTNPSCNGCTMLDFCKGNRCKIVNKLVSGDYYVPATVTCMSQNVNVEMYSYMK